MRIVPCPLAAILSLALAIPALAQATRPATAPATQPARAGSRVSAVTVYEQTALVTRTVEVPAGEGLVELVVGPLPTSLQPNSLYVEAGDAGDDVRILTTRYRQRTERTATDDEVKALEQQIADLQLEMAKATARQQGIEQDLAFIEQMQSFTAATARETTADATLDAETVIKLAQHVTTGRRELMDEKVEIARQTTDLQQQISFSQQQLQSVRAKADRVLREAVIVLDNTTGNLATVELSYLVTAAGWRPFYKLRAANEGAATLEYLASIQQQSGEDWSDVALTLSTATPRLNAAPPELTALAVVLGETPGGPSLQQQAPGAAAGQPTGKAVYEEAQRQRVAAQMNYEQQAAMPGQQKIEANAVVNRAAAGIAEAELLGGEEIAEEARRAGTYTEGQSVTYALEGTVSVPWRDDEQLLEIGRFEMELEYVYKAVPVLTPHVYRLARLTNTSQEVILPGPAMMYLEGDFVGRGDLPLVAGGESFTAGLGVDPQLRVERVLLNRDSTVQGGNQVRSLEYLIRVRSFKEEQVPVQLWDRLPQEQANTVSVEMSQTSVPLSEDAEYLQTQRPQGLLRWDLEAPAGEATEVRFTYSIAYDRKFHITGLEAE